MRTFSDNEATRRGLLGSLIPAALPEPGSRPTARFPAALLPWSWAAALFLLYATVSVRRHTLLRTTGYDLGIFDQAVRAYSQLQPPVVPLRGEQFNLLGDHFHPALAVLAPFYRVWPSPSVFFSPSPHSSPSPPYRSCAGPCGCSAGARRTPSPSATD